MNNLTKKHFNPHESNLIYMIIGSIIGALFSAFNVMVSLKTGLSVDTGNVTALLGFIVLIIIGRYKKYRVCIIQATAAGGAMCMFAIDSAIAASVMYTDTIPSIITISLIGIIASILGIIIAYILHDFFIKQSKLVFPLAVSAAKIIDTLSNNSKGKYKYLVIGGIVAILITVPINILNILPENLLGSLLGLPSFIGIALSPMLFAVGFMIGSKPSKTMMVGGLFSCIIWLFSEGASASTKYSTHSNNVWIMSVGVTVMIMSAVLNLWNVKAQMIKIFSNMGIGLKRIREKCGTNKIIIGSMLLIIISSLLIYMANTVIKNYIICGIILIPMILISVIFGCMASGETGLAPVTPLGIITFLLLGVFVKDFKIIMYAGAIVCAISLSSINMVTSFKIGDLLNVPKKSLFKGQIVGSFIGVLIGSIVIIILNMNYKFGSEALPTPVSVTWGIIVQSLSNGEFPVNINLYLCIISVIITIIIGKYKMSPICLGIGIIIPPALTFSIFIGGLVRSIISLKYKNRETLMEEAIQKGELIGSGLIIGECIILIFSFIKILI